MKRTSIRAACAALAGGIAAGLFVSAAAAAELDGQRLIQADKEPGNWMTYHGTYKSWHYSPLDQINTSNVGRLQDAWSHVASRANRGLQGFPLAIDGVLYYASPYNQLYALDGASGQPLWTYKQKLDEDLVARQTHSPYNRGIAAGYGNIYMGTLDGKLVAVDMKTGQLKWEAKLINSEKLTVGFTGAPLLVKDKVIIGSQGGEWPYRGPIFGVDAKNGNKVWEFFTVGGNPDNGDARNTWGNDSWKVGGGGELLLKRGLDLAVAGLALVVTAPLLAGLAVLVRLDSPGPAFFVQERVGENGRRFRILKLRSMVAGADETPTPKHPTDPRVTRLGRFLRRWSLDELPQFWNVLRGEMSLVGPRPEEPRVVAGYTDWHRARLAVKPGITGPMQINGRGDLPLDDRVRLELDYIEHYSLGRDLVILLRTVPAVLRGDGAY